VVIEAGELRKTSPLRAICEKAKNAVAIACYADDERDIAKVVDDELRKAGLAIAPDARAALMPFLGGDRRATRGELQKLALYAHGHDRITVEDVMAVVADASAVALDNVIDAAFAGKPAEVESHFAKARGEGTAPGSIISAALRHLSNLHRMRLTVEDGQSVTGAVEGARPPIHFRRKSSIDTALRAWTAAKLTDAMQTLAEAQLQTRLQANLSDAIAQRALMALATAARKRS
jgi:DNA polymerase-3 subunit delta